MNNLKLRNNLLCAKKAPLNTPECPFRGVFIQEDLTQQMSKILKVLKAHGHAERVRTHEGRIQVTLKEDSRAGKNITVENPDLKLGIDTIDITQFGYPVM